MNGFDAARERELIKHRRERWGTRAPTADAPLAGLALSGGGIRSATFSLGFIQGVADAKRLPHIDYLSTVSGGGYAGAFVGSLFLPRLNTGAVPDSLKGQEAQETPLQAAERVEQLLCSPAHADAATLEFGSATEGGAGPEPQTAARAFHPLRWLRENGRYLTPSGIADTLFLAAFYLRSLAGVHYVLGLALLGAAFLAYGLRLALHGIELSFASQRDWNLNAFGWAADVPAPSLDLWWSPIVWITLAPLLMLAGPLVLAYWIVYRQENKDFMSAEERVIQVGPWWLLVACVALLVPLLSYGQRANPVTWLLVYGAYLAVAAIAVRDGWLNNKLGAGWQTEQVKVARARLKLTQGLTWVLKLVLALAAIGLVDSIGQTIYVAALRAQTIEWAALGSGGGALAVVLVLLRRLAEATLGADARAWKQTLMRYQRPTALIAGVLALLALAAFYVAVLQFVVWSYAWPRWFGTLRAPDAGLTTWHAALLAGALAAWLLLVFLARESLGFLNNSTFHRFYAARLTRTFLGAANFVRLREFAKAARDARMPVGSEVAVRALEKLFVSETHPDDDVALSSYYGAQSCAPLHLINVTLNESRSRTSALTREDRKGLPLAVGPAGLGVGDTFYRWRTQPNHIGTYVMAADEDETTVETSPQALCERLSLGQWAAVSGAAVSTGLGRLSLTGFSVIAWLINARLAYWWQTAPLMRAEARDSSLKTFDLVRQEITGGFYGRRGARWNLSDGGHFENTAAYELIRRRVPLIVCSDNGADPGYRFPDLQNLVRRARVDFGAELCFLDRAELQVFAERWLPEHIDAASRFGTLEDFSKKDERGACCALLAFVKYPGTKQCSLLVVVKPVVADFMPVDIKLYAREQQNFPQQPTSDQFFDEAQWESYRKLGFETARVLLPYWDGLAAVAAALGSDTYDSK